jgi:putative redox protein
MKDAINVKWTGDMAFETVVDEHKILMDTKPEVGGKNSGPRPKLLLMVSLAGCTGMDVISILKKMKVVVTGFNMQVIGDIAEEHPKRFTAVKLVYEFTGNDLPVDKIRHAIELSQEKYCGVIATLKESVKINYEIKIDES